MSGRRPVTATSVINRKNRVGAVIHPCENGRMNDYQRIALVIRYLDEHRTRQPDLASLAEYLGLSPFHFHRLFTAWAAITPKDFLQCLTLAHAKELLRKGESVMDAALMSGLSGPGRLHDLCINLEAATPGELKSGGAGWTIVAGISASPFGRCLIAESPRGICRIAFVASESGEEDWAALQEDWPHARLYRDDGGAAQLADRIFASPDSAHSGSALRGFVQGTAFQVRVWRALLQVQPGSLISYGRLAGTLGMPAAARAVGGAVGKNPLAYLIPCHRVIRETGVVGGYRWGPTRKRAMMVWESSPAFAADMPGATRADARAEKMASMSPPGGDSLS
jgi:AraC family transcriptional regulator of adaptative response/methylated-DNA-[protein]-cysteine methyltransferase